jgi:hypothetical protein
MKYLILSFIFTTIVAISLYSQNLENNVNSGSGEFVGDTLIINYVIGEPIISFASDKVSLTSIPLANLIDSTDGIYTAEGIAFKVFPNPVKDIFYISIDQSNNYNIRIYDLDGNLISNLYSGFINSNDNIGCDISTFNLPTTTYLVNIKSNTINTFVHIIIEK